MTPLSYDSNIVTYKSEERLVYHMRSLATIQAINGMKPIEGADLIELVLIKGWQCVAKKGEFQAGDFCVYFEV